MAVVTPVRVSMVVHAQYWRMAMNAPVLLDTSACIVKVSQLNLILKFCLGKLGAYSHDVLIEVRSLMVRFSGNSLQH